MFFFIISIIIIICNNEACQRLKPFLLYSSDRPILCFMIYYFYV